MAHRSSATRLHISAAPPFPISKDFPGSENSIPLSPQWLLPKPGESKPGIGNVENHVILTPPYGNHSETVKTSGNGEGVNDDHKRKDVFRPSMLDSEIGRRGRWRDEERDTKSSIRKDRWRDGDKDLSEARRVDRWTENSSMRHIGEARRGTSDRWNDLGNREMNFDQRRESKWNTRWRPDDKEPEGIREKWSDPGKDGDLHVDKSLSNISNPSKDEKEGDHYRPWRPNFSQNRGRVEPPQLQNVMQNKQVPTYSYGRAHGEDTPPKHAQLGSGVSSTNSTYMHTQYPGIVLDKVESGHGEARPFRYSRTNLLDVYLVIDMHTNRKLVDDFVQIPSLTQDEPLEPLALCAPNSEELSVLKDIDKGEIISSSALKVPKDGRNTTEFAHSRRTKLANAPLQDKAEDGGSYPVADEVSSNRESTFEENNSIHPGAACHAMPLGEHAVTLMHDSRDVCSDIKSRNSDMSSSHQHKDPHIQWEGNLDYLSETRDVAKWQSSGDTIVSRQLTGILDNELESRRVPQTSAEELSLFYKDPQGQVQGPFKGIDIIGWFEAGYFGIDLPVRVENASSDSPWMQLGDAMPHLQAKAQAPPGFSAAKLDCTEAPGWLNSSTFGKIHTGFGEVEMLRNDSMHRSSSTEAENRFLESLMSGSKSSPSLNSLTLSEGLHGFLGYNSGNMGPSGVDSGNNLYLLAKRIALERQRSLPNPYLYWPGRDAASLPPKPDIFPDAIQHSNILSSVSDNSQLWSKNSELMSIIQGLSDRSSTGLNNVSLNNGVAGWPNYRSQGGLDPLQNKIDLQHDQNFLQIPFGIQQQRLQVPNQLSLNNLVAQTSDNPTSILTAEKLLSSCLTQDPHMLNMLQQQQLLQLHSQAAAPSQQMPSLDNLLLLKQQQQQEEQQLLLRQQQQLLSQVLQEHQSHQLFGELSNKQLPGGGIPMGNLRVDLPQIQPQKEIFPVSSQTPIPSVHDEFSTKSLDLSLQVSQGHSYNISSESSVQLPHQLFGNISHQKSWGPTLPKQINQKYQKETLPASSSIESSLLHEQKRAKEVPNTLQTSLSISDSAAKSMEQMSDDSCRADGNLVSANVESDENSQPGQSVSPVVAMSSTGSCGRELPLASQLSKDMEIKSDSLEEKQVGRDSSNIEPSVLDARNIEACEPKKTTEKKSKKQKSSKSQSSDQAKGLVKSVNLQQPKKSEAEKRNYSEKKLGEANKVESTHETCLQQTSDKSIQSGTATAEADDDREVSDVPTNIPGNIIETVVENELKAVSFVATKNTELPSGRAWKPAPGLKAKSLLEIQQEEQKKAQVEMVLSEVAASVSSMSPTTPWVGAVANPDSMKLSSDSHREADKTEYLPKFENSQNGKSKKSPLHDLLAEDAKQSNESDGKVLDSILPSQNSEPIDDGNFIEAKDTKRSRKKSTKSKSSGSKASMPVASNEVPISSIPIEKGKSSRSVHQEKEQLPAIPSGPSLGDFVLWKGEPTSLSPPPAWTTDSGRVPKPTSLRGIQREQEKKSSAVPQNQVPTPLKSQPAQVSRSNGSPWPISASSPSKAAPSSQINSQTSLSKYKGDDELFWGPIEQSKQETKQSNFPQLASQGSWGSKNTPMKGNSPRSLSQQKSGNGKPTERSLSSSLASSQALLKLKKDAMTKNSEALDFRVWCENECVRLIGTKDTSFLEFCLKQSRSEAEMFLVENLGSFDPDHVFIDKFLNYMDLLPSDVLEIAFQTLNDQRVAVGMIPGNTDVQDLDHTEGSSSKGLKKGKKGKKVSSSVLGFQVVSNRIMMGEIQTVED